jgi:hypothetical protein
MFGLFGKKKEGEAKLPGPKDIPELIGRYMVVEMKQEPNYVWALKGVVKPAGGKKDFYCRVFDTGSTAKANVNVKDWTSLDSHPELVLFEGYFNKDTLEVRREKVAAKAA